MGVRKPITWEVNENGCHLVTSHYLNKGGYARVNRDGKTQLLHRVVYEKHLGLPIPKGLVVRHSCDNSSCINPSHLSEGTPQDNSDDMVSRGRQASLKGRANGKCLLTEAHATQIKYLFIGCSLSRIAKLYSVTPQQVSLIRLGKRWPHI